MRPTFFSRGGLARVKTQPVLIIFNRTLQALRLQWVARVFRALNKEAKFMKLYVGNLSSSTTEEVLLSKFGAHGEVQDLAMITDRDTDRSRGFGFVTMDNSEEANAAMAALDGTELEGRKIRVIEAKPRGNPGSGRPRYESQQDQG
jgi:RNA recognition motif-containing protein